MANSIIAGVQQDPTQGFQKEGKNFNCYWVTLQGQDNGNFKMFTMAGSKMEQELNSGQAIGRTLYYEMSAKGNLTRTNLDEPKKAWTGGGGGSKGSYGANDPKRQASIIRQSCLKAAVESLGSGKSTQEYINRTIEFEQFVNQAGGASASPASGAPAPQMQMEAPQPIAAPVGQEPLPPMAQMTDAPF